MTFIFSWSAVKFLRFSRVGKSLFAISLKLALFKEWLWAICSCRSLKKSNHERIVLIALYIRTTVNEKVMTVNHSRCSFKRSNVSDSLFSSKKPAIRSKKVIFSRCFWQFFTAFPLAPIAPIALRSVALFWSTLAIRSHGSLLTSDREQFTPIAISLFRSQKEAIRLKTQQANSQPCDFLIVCRLHVLSCNLILWFP